ncbi:hypothetical protein NCC78_00025 [Micromonospora phytophila]|uniref:hypothetical protein n=1 Tax=Micromonospora phytophila TaxID=709888 RepID=UPI00202EE5D4|nr:hypothetical protein [Micromonospora phytophila]MCM0673127.1 hypothetical protein [Micromonospora phytophila]
MKAFKLFEEHPHMAHSRWSALVGPARASSCRDADPNELQVADVVEADQRGGGRFPVARW